ncbi:LysR family transcriptional regulator [Pusillimonas sp. ANT_WB101]|uniref:LysR family transcriptional regulator n=1 Tax=Pusillimonas sp. ANT_WB101 TaxID=2597356 RepID=UPI00165D6523|nr:LysR family transcriptional regulator [Pusillimonas sp. ANT_WB101]
MDMLRQLIAKLRLKQLELICLLAEYGTLRAAAKVLNMTPAAASKSLREIESLLKTSLFDRTSNGMTLTNSGTLVFDYAKGTLDNTRLLIQNIDNAANGDTPIKIATPPFIAWTFLSQVLEDFYQKPQLNRVRIHEERLGDSSKLLESDVVDVLITMKSSSELASLGLNEYFIKTVLRQSWNVVCARGNSLAKRTESLAWSDLVNQRWILPPYPTYTRILFNQIIHKHELKYINPLVEATNATTTLSLIKRNIGIGLLSDSVIRAMAEPNMFSIVPVEPALEHVDIVFVCKKKIQHRPEITSLLSSCETISKTLER